MPNTSIFAGEKSFDIGCRVIKWDEPQGLNLTPYGKFSKSNLNYDGLKSKVKQFTVHWSVTYRSAHTFTGIKARGLSVNFLIDDDDVGGYATIHQCLDCTNFGWSQGGSFNTLGYGVEMAYMPDAFTADRYTPALINKFNTQAHETAFSPVHGTKLKVHLPTKAQINSLIQLLWGISELFPNVSSSFPKNDKGEYITTKLSAPEAYKGYLSHYHLTKEKIDTAGLDYKYIEEQVELRKKLGY